MTEQGTLLGHGPPLAIGHKPGLFYPLLLPVVVWLGLDGARELSKKEARWLVKRRLPFTYQGCLTLTPSAYTVYNSGRTPVGRVGPEDVAMEPGKPPWLIAAFLPRGPWSMSAPDSCGEDSCVIEIDANDHQHQPQQQAFHCLVVHFLTERRSQQSPANASG